MCWSDSTSPSFPPAPLTTPLSLSYSVPTSFLSLPRIASHSPPLLTDPPILLSTDSPLLSDHQAADLWLDYSSDTASSSQNQSHSGSGGGSSNPLALPLQVRPARGSTSVMDWLASRETLKGG